MGTAGAQIWEMARTVHGSSRVARYVMGLCNVRTIHSRGQFGARSPALGPTIYQAVCPQSTSLPVCLAAARVSFCTTVSATDRLREVNLCWSREVKLAMQQRKQAEGVLELIQQAGLTPDNNFFVALIQEFGYAKQPLQAEPVLELMQ